MSDLGAAVVLALVVVVRAPVVVSEAVLGGVAWLLQFDPGKLYNVLASMASLCSEAVEIQMSAQDPSFTQLPVSVSACVSE